MTRPPACASSARAAIEYEPLLVEESARFALEHGSPDLTYAQVVRLRHRNRRRLAKLYSLPQGEERESAFQRHFWTLFRTLRLDRVPAGWLEAFPQLGTDLELILVRSARGRSDEGAELWESREHRGRGIPSYLVIAVRPSALRRPEELNDRVLPDLQRAADQMASPSQIHRQSPPSPSSALAAGTHCPLCRFPTTDWASPNLLPGIAPSIKCDFPDWAPADRCCGHCAERYQSLAAPSNAR
jgi:hypothetical protein